MKRSIKSVAATVVATLATAGLALVAAPAAMAATGTLTLNPATGFLDGRPAIVTSAACSSGATQFAAYLSGGPNAWPADTNLWANPRALAQGFQVSDTILNFAAANSLSLVPAAGTTATTPYDVKGVCLQGGNIVDTFTGQLTITLAGAAAAATDSYTVVDNTPASSLTAPTLNPASGITANSTSVTFSTVLTAPTLGAGVTTGGTVQFKVGSTNLGAAVTVANLTNAAAGVTVTQTAQFPASGTNLAVTAVFSGTTGVVKPFTSASTSATVAGPNANTSLALTTNATSITTLDNAVLTATVTNLGTPAGATSGFPVGAVVTFSNGTTALGTGTVNASGVATFTVSGSTLGAGGPYTLSASLPTGGGFTGSSGSLATGITVTAPTTLFVPPPSPQTIQTNVVAGTITVSGGVTATTGAVTLGFPGIVDGGVQKYALQLNPTGTLLTNNGALKTDGHNQLYRILVTDGRAGNLGYKVTGVVASNFTSGANVIDSATLGWTPKVGAACTGAQVPSPNTFTYDATKAGTGYEATPATTGVDCSTATAVAGAAVVPGAAGTTDGLKTARTLFTTTAGASNGTVSATADLLLNAPTTTKAGYYTTQLTLTALSN